MVFLAIFEKQFVACAVLSVLKQTWHGRGQTQGGHPKGNTKVATLLLA